MGRLVYNIMNHYKQWPDDDKPTQFSQMADSICDAIRFAYSLDRQNEDLDIPWNGLNIGKEDRRTCHQPIEQLSTDTLACSEDQGRDALDEIVGLAIRLGIEQGRRIFKDSTEYSMMKIRANLREKQ